MEMLSFDRSDAVTFPGLISGAGSVSQIGGGTTILTADNTYTGGTTIAAGTLQLGDGGRTGSILGDVTDNGTLAFDRRDTMTFAGVISGSGAVTQIGSGTTILTADNPYTGGTTVSGGALVVGDFAHPSAALSGGGPILVQPGGTLGGYGSVTGPVINSGVIARRQRCAGVPRLADRDLHHHWQFAQSRRHPARFRSEHWQCAGGSRQLCWRRRRDGHQHVPRSRWLALRQIGHQRRPRCDRQYIGARRPMLAGREPLRPLMAFWW